MNLRDISTYWDKLAATFGTGIYIEAKRAKLGEEPTKQDCLDALTEADSGMVGLNDKIEYCKLDIDGTKLDIQKLDKKIAEIEQRKAAFRVRIERIEKDIENHYRDTRHLNKEKQNVLSLMSKTGYGVPEEVYAVPNDFARAMTYGIGHRG